MRVSHIAITWTEHNGSDAFDHYRQCESGIRDLPDLFITDISMRGLSGVDMSRAIRYTNGTMPILGITSYEPTQFYHDAADAGMQAVIGKNELSALKSIIMEVADTGALAVRPPFEVPGRAHLRIRQEGLPYILSLSQQEKQVLTMCSTLARRPSTPTSHARRARWAWPANGRQWRYGRKPSDCRRLANGEHQDHDRAPGHAAAASP